MFRLYISFLLHLWFLFLFWLLNIAHAFVHVIFFFENYVHVIFAKLIVKKERKKNDRGMDLITVEIVYTGSNYF